VRCHDGDGSDGEDHESCDPVGGSSGEAGRGIQ
jgi:hypothetical protein